MLTFSHATKRGRLSCGASSVSPSHRVLELWLPHWGDHCRPPRRLPAPGQRTYIGSTARETVQELGKQSHSFFPRVLFCPKRYFQPFSLCYFLWYLKLVLTLNLLFSSYPEAIKRNINGTLIQIKGVPLNCTAETLIEVFKSFRC